MPNGYKIDQMAIKYTNIYHCKTLPNLPKLGLWVWKETIWQPWMKEIQSLFSSRVLQKITYETKSQFAKFSLLHRSRPASHSLQFNSWIFFRLINHDSWRTTCKKICFRHLGTFPSVHRLQFISHHLCKASSEWLGNFYCVFCHQLARPDFIICYFFCPMPLFIFFKTHTMHIRSII
jgi:hypothetical protein